MEDHITNYEQSKKLHEKGVKCCSKYSWVEKDGAKALMETKDVEDCDCCYPALTLDECKLIIKKCHQKVSWKKDKDVLKIQILGIVDLTIDKTQEEKEIETDCEIVVLSIIHLINCEEIDCDFINCILKKHTGYCYEKKDKHEECDDHEKPDCEMPKPPKHDKCCEEVKKEVKELASLADCLRQAVVCLSGAIEGLQGEIKCLREEVKLLDETVDCLRDDITCVQELQKKTLCKLKKVKKCCCKKRKGCKK